jgi:hypothetical protein
MIDPRLVFLARASARLILVEAGKLGFEVFDRDERSIGVYPTQREAANAIPNNEEKKCS